MARITSQLQGETCRSLCNPSPLFSTSIRLILNRFLVAVLGVSVSGCVSAIALDRAVVAYDRTAVELVSKQLLLNIARARHNQPMHFTADIQHCRDVQFCFHCGRHASVDRGTWLPARADFRRERGGKSHHQYYANAGRRIHPKAADPVSRAEAHYAVAPGL